MLSTVLRGWRALVCQAELVESLKRAHAEEMQRLQESLDSESTNRKAVRKKAKDLAHELESRKAQNASQEVPAFGMYTCMLGHTDENLPLLKHTQRACGEKEREHGHDFGIRWYWGLTLFRVFP